MSVCRDVAETDFNRILKAARVKIDKKRDKDGQEGFNSFKEAVISEIIEGNITVGESGFPTVLVDFPDCPEWTFKRRWVGKDFLAEDKYRSPDSAECIYAMIGRLTDNAPKYINELGRDDIERLQAVYAIFRYA